MNNNIRGGGGYEELGPSRNNYNQQDPNRPGWTARDSGITWDPGAADLVQGRTRIDPTTGSLIGPDSLIPHQLGLQYQAEHDRRIFDYRQRLMADAQRYGEGALGLMQSFRPGGGAAIEAGQYNTLAQIQLNRAQLTQPMDLLGDYRRHEQAIARQKANRQAERSLAIQGTIAAASIAAAPFTGGLSLLALGGAAGMAQQQQRVPGGGQQTQHSAPPTAPGTMPAQPGVMGTPGGGGAAMGPASAGGGQAPAGGAAQMGLEGGGGSGGPPGASSGGMKRVAGSPGGGGPGSPQGASAGGGAGFAGGGGGMGIGAGVGADGVFTPQAYAMAAAGQQDPILDAMLMSQTADQVDDDPFYGNYSYAVNSRLAARMAAL